MTLRIHQSSIQGANEYVSSVQSERKSRSKENSPCRSRRTWHRYTNWKQRPSTLAWKKRHIHLCVFGSPLLSVLKELSRTRDSNAPSTRGNLLSIAIFAIRLAASCITRKGPANSSFSLLVCSDCEAMHQLIASDQGLMSEGKLDSLSHRTRNNSTKRHIVEGSNR